MKRSILITYVLFFFSGYGNTHLLPRTLRKKFMINLDILFAEIVVEHLYLVL